jgi:putative endonuclease
MYIVYWLISEHKDKTYVGFTENIKQRIKKHKEGGVRSTKAFGKFRCIILDRASDICEARRKEKYWKSSAGRKKLKLIFNKLGPIV